jgi:hypothetical protein
LLLFINLAYIYIAGYALFSGSSHPVRNNYLVTMTGIWNG